MQICRVIGNVVSTAKNERLKDKKILLVQPLDLQGNPTGKTVVALDTVDAGEGDRVLLMREGGSARIVFDDDSNPVQAVITAVVDDVEIQNKDDAKLK